MRRFRKGAGFHRLDQCTTKLDRNDKARIIHCAEKLEVRTKQQGRKSGALGQSGLQVLRCLLYHFHNATTGCCDPGYTAICARTGLCRQCVADALGRLADAGIIAVMRRLLRNGWRVVQDTNAYLFPATTPLLPPSLRFREEHTCKGSFPYRKPSPLLSIPLSKALEALGERIAERIAHEGQVARP
jgi:hypothetical protein